MCSVKFDILNVVDQVNPGRGKGEHDKRNSYGGEHWELEYATASERRRQPKNILQPLPRPHGTYQPRQRVIDSDGVGPPSGLRGHDHPLRRLASKVGLALSHRPLCTAQIW
jgi:hypothetical protein